MDSRDTNQRMLDDQYKRMEENLNGVYEKNNPKIKHTPGEWYAENGIIKTLSKGKLIAHIDIGRALCSDSESVPVIFGLPFDRKESEANAAFICKAVNNHEKLVGALEYLVRILENDYDREEQYEEMKSLLASLEEKPTT